MINREERRRLGPHPMQRLPPTRNMVLSSTLQQQRLLREQHSDLHDRRRRSHDGYHNRIRRVKLNRDACSCSKNGHRDSGLFEYSVLGFGFGQWELSEE
jgi:hypothetical protein